VKARLVVAATRSRLGGEGVGVLRLSDDEGESRGPDREFVRGMVTVDNDVSASVNSPVCGSRTGVSSP